MSTTSVIQAAGPTVVALAAIGATIWQQRRGLRHTREMADLSAVRAVLDDAALALHRAGEAMKDQVVDGDAAVDRAVTILKDELEPLTARLVVRFGNDHAVVRWLSEAAGALDAWTDTALYLGLPRDHGGPSGARRGQEEAKLTKTASMFGDASGLFLEAAVKTAGARLRSPRVPT